MEQSPSEKLIGPQLNKKFPSFYGTHGFITTFTRARLLCLTWTRSIQSTSPSHFLKDHFNIILPSIPGSSKWPLMPPHQYPVRSPPLPIHAVYPTHLTLLDLIKEYTSQSSSLCSLLHSPVTARHLDGSEISVDFIGQSYQPIHTLYTLVYHGRCPLWDFFNGCIMDLFVSFVLRFEHCRSLRSCTRNFRVCRANKDSWITVGNCERSNSALILLHLWAVRGKTHRRFLMRSYCAVLSLEERLAHVKPDTGQKNISYVLSSLLHRAFRRITLSPTNALT